MLRIALFSVIASATICSAETIQLRADSWLPYNGDPQEGHIGYAIEITKTIFEPTGVVVDYQLMPWAEALTAAKAGKVDAVIGANPDEAEGLVRPTKSIGTPRVAIYTLKDSTWGYQNVALLPRIKLGVIEGYKYWPALDAYIDKPNNTGVVKFGGDKPLQTAITALRNKEIDALIETNTVFTWTLNQLGQSIADFRRPYLHEGEPAYLAFNPHNKNARQYCQQFDAGIAELRKSGELAKILEKYGLADWESSAR